MHLDSNTTVREIAVHMPQSTRIFEKLNIDYCCGGNTRVVDACTKAGIEVEQLEQMLADSQPAPVANPLDFQNMTLNALTTYIVDKHHVFTKAEITRLGSLLAKVVSVHGNNHPELLALQPLFDRVSDDLNPHMFKEEQILFPYIQNLETAVAHKSPAPFAPFGTVNNPIRMMMMEHDAVGDILREMRKITNDYQLPADACISYQTLYAALIEFEQDLHQHIHLENNILFPRALKTEELV